MDYRKKLMDMVTSLDEIIDEYNNIVVYYKRLKFFLNTTVTVIIVGLRKSKCRFVFIIN